MEPEPFKYPGHGGWSDIFEMQADVFSLHSESHEFASANYFQYPQVTFRKEIQPAVRTPFFYNGTGDLCKVLLSAAMVFDGCYELQVAVVGGLHNSTQLIQAVDAFFNGAFSSDELPSL